MKVIRVGNSPQDPLVAADVPPPQPSTGEVLIRVYAAGVTPTELQWYPTSHRKSGEKRSGAIPGHEFSGVIAAAGSDTDGFAIGDEVFGMNDWFEEGAMAEYCTARFDGITHKPKRLTHPEAASVPIGALTAWQGLFERAKLRQGERVLVHGGSGAVGAFAVQLARMRGATVIATASARNLEFVAGLGADQVLDYRGPRFEDSVGQADVIFDTAGGETLERSWSVLSPGGRMVTIVSEAADLQGRAKDAFFIVEPNRNQLSGISELLDSGTIRPVVDSVIPLSRASDAFAGRVERSGRGKIVVALKGLDDEQA